MLPLTLTFGFVPIFIDLCKCRSSWICIFISRPYVFVRLFFGNLTRKLIYLCFASYVSQVSDSTIIVIWKCIEFALFDHWSFELWAYYPHRLMFLYVLISPDLFPAMLSLFDKIEPRVLPWLDRYWMFLWKHHFVRVLDSYPHLLDSTDS